MVPECMTLNAGPEIEPETSIATAVATPGSPRWATRMVLIGIAVGAGWRLGVLVVDKWRQPMLLNDSLYYTAQAQQLVRGVWFREIFADQPGAEHGPLTSVVLASVSWLPQPVPWQRLVTVLVGIAGILVIAQLARLVGGWRAGLIAAWIAAVYPNLWMNDGLVMSESLSILLVSVTLVMGHHLISSPPPDRVLRIAVLTGVAAGAGVLARSELALLLVLLVVLVFRATSGSRGQRGRVAFVVAASAVVMIAPWVVFNLHRFERPVLLTTNDGTTLIGSYCDETFAQPPFDDTQHGGWTVDCVVADPDYRADEEPSVRSGRQRSIAVSYARGHLGDLPGVIAARVGRSFDLTGLGSLVRQDVGEERYRWASWAGIVAWWLLAPLAVYGWWLLDSRRRQLLVLPVISVLATTIAFYGAHRIRSSMEPVVVVTAAVALSILWVRCSGSAGSAGSVGIVGGLGEDAAGERKDDHEEAGTVEVLERPGPGGIDREAIDQFPANDQ